MRKSKKIWFKIISRGQFLFTLVSCLIALTAIVTMDAAYASKEISLDESLDFTVIIDAGHGGIDPGSIGYKTKTKESEINLSVAKKLEEKLRRIGIRVVMTRKDSSGLYGLSTTNYKKRDMQARKKIIEDINPNIVISVHMNSYIRHNLRGAQVFYDKNSSTSEALALCIQDQFASKLEKSDKGVSVGDYYMLKCTESASVITECGFLSNEEDEKLLINEEYQDRIAECIFIGVVNYLNIE